jgi:hypothetical protein
VLRFVGNEDSMKVHTTSCDYADKIAPDSQGWFTELYDALSLGYEECGYCLTDDPLQQRARRGWRPTP